MSAGRCAGCGKSSSSCKAIEKHVMTCPEFIALYKADPAAALDPEQEYVRYRDETDHDAVRAENRDARLSARIAEVDVQRDKQEARWRKRDPLALDADEPEEANAP